MRKKLTSYIDAMKEASFIIRGENPDYLVAPMLGSVPFIDAMALVDKDFDPQKVVYMPASSRIKDVNNVIRKWYFNFLEDVVDSPDIFPKIIGIDEVVSGASVMRCLCHIDQATEKKRKRILQSILKKLHCYDLTVAEDAIDEADIITNNKHNLEFLSILDKILQGQYSNNYSLARKDTEFISNSVKSNLANRLVYKTIGIEDSKRKGNRNGNYEQIKKQGRVIPVEVDSIITMDVPEFCSPRFTEVVNPQGKPDYVRFSPFVKDFKVTPEYLEFLQSIARYIGIDPDKVAPINMTAILNSNKYLERH